MRCVQKSPGFPDRYAANKDCVYVINAPNGKQIQLNVESFDLEESNGCSFDSLEIRSVFMFKCHKNLTRQRKMVFLLQFRNGASDTSPLIGTYCGTDILPRFKSFSNRIYLRFRSDSSNENTGKICFYIRLNELFL